MTSCRALSARRPRRKGPRPASLALLPLAVALAAGCTGAAVPELPAPVLLDVPAPAGAAEPSVTTWGDRLVVSWIEPDTTAQAAHDTVASPAARSHDAPRASSSHPPPNGNSATDGRPPARPGGADTARHAAAAGRPGGSGRAGPRAHALRFAVWDGSGWSEPRTIARGAGWFVNWADFPSLLALDERTLVAHWLQRTAASPYAYDVMLTRSLDAGATWSEPVRPHRDGTPTEHGFVSFVTTGTGAGLVWLDGRRFHGPDATKEMTVRFTTLAANGSLGDEMLLDDRACDCCQTAAAMTADGPLVAYRDRTADEIRDIAVTRLVDGRWTPPRRLHEDGWHINACPVNGPQADAAQRDVVVAWYTAASDSPRVQVSFSTDAGATFAAPIRVDDGNPIGRVDVSMTDAGDALVVWLERVGEAAEVRARLVGPRGRGPARVIATTGAQRASGFPRIARLGGRVLFVWTDVDTSSSVRAATLELPR